jgi:hypothetical protein
MDGAGRILPPDVRPLRRGLKRRLSSSSSRGPDAAQPCPCATPQSIPLALSLPLSFPVPVPLPLALSISFPLALSISFPFPLSISLPFPLAAEPVPVTGSPLLRYLRLASLPA